MVEIEQIDYTRLDELLGLLRERSEWLINIGAPMWNPEWLIKESFIERYNNPLCFLAKDNANTIGGFILLEKDEIFWKDYPQENTYYIHKLVIDLKYKGQGYAGQIIKEIINYAKLAGKKRLRLDYYDDRAYLKKLYTGLGFVPVEILTMPDNVKICICEMKI